MFIFKIIIVTIRECFLSFMQHKFRTNVGQAKKIKKGTNVLIALSGGDCSRFVLTNDFINI